MIPIFFMSISFLCDVAHRFSGIKIAPLIRERHGFYSFLFLFFLQLNGNLPRITSSTDTILNICKGQSVGSIGYYTYNGSLIPSDYPSRLLDAGAHYQPIMIVYKTATSISTILIYDVVNTSGYPRGIQGYCNGSRLFWGDIF